MSYIEIEDEVATLLTSGDGHGFDHVMRVKTMAVQFAEIEGADKQVVELAALLHDVDDYKLFGEEAAHNLSNASAILDRYEIDKEVKDHVLTIIKTMGYNKYLDGSSPTTLEGKIVSDADMCDAIGAEGILRTHAYTLSKDNQFFDINLAPQNSATDAAEYRRDKKSHSVQHFFDKLLVIP